MVMRPSERVVEVRGLTKRFGTVTAVDDLSFTVQPGRVTGFLGPNGAGKTTTLRSLLGLVNPTAGSATVGGRRYVDLPDPQRDVGALLEASSFHSGRTARNSLRVAAGPAGIPDRRVDELLALVDLTDAADRRVGEFSLGMRQRLGLAQALLGDPGVLVLDEPANGLDPEGIAWLRTFLRSFAARGPHGAHLQPRAERGAADGRRRRHRRPRPAGPVRLARGALRRGRGARRHARAGTTRRRAGRGRHRGAGAATGRGARDRDERRGRRARRVHGRGGAARSRRCRERPGVDLPAAGRGSARHPAAAASADVFFLGSDARVRRRPPPPPAPTSEVAP